MEIFKVKWFNKWAHKHSIPDSLLTKTAMEIVSGNVEADLGGGLFKKRLAREGEGKRGGYRTLVGFSDGSGRIFYLYAFAKNTRANIKPNEKAVLVKEAQRLVTASQKEIRSLLELGTIMEVKNNE